MQTAFKRQPARQLGKPVVIDLKPSKIKAKRRTSPALAEIQHYERHLTRAAQRLTGALERGLAEYRTRSRKSARKKKDGALRDLLQNSGRGLRVSLKEASALPLDVARTLDSRQNRRRIKRQVRLLSRALR